MHKLLLAASVSAALVSVSAAHADTLFTYTFAPGSTLTFNGSAPTYATTGGFTFDATTNSLSNIAVTDAGSNGTFTFTTGSVLSANSIALTGDGDGDQLDYTFANPLSQGGADAITGVTYPTEPGAQVSASGSVISPTTVSAAPEPGAWALMLGGVGAMGLMLRRRRTVGVAA